MPEKLKYNILGYNMLNKRNYKILAIMQIDLGWICGDAKRQTTKAQRHKEPREFNFINNLCALRALVSLWLSFSQKKNLDFSVR